MKKLIALLEDFNGTENDLELIEKETFEIIDSPKFGKIPDSIKDYIYILNMQDINNLTVSDIHDILPHLKAYINEKSNKR